MKKLLLIFTLLFSTVMFSSPSFSEGDDLQKAINQFFPNQIKVYGVKIIGTQITPRKDIKKAAKILRQWLDNNGDDKPDNSLVVDELIKNNAILSYNKFGVFYLY